MRDSFGNKYSCLPFFRFSSDLPAILDDYSPYGKPPPDSGSTPPSLMLFLLLLFLLMALSLRPPW